MLVLSVASCSQISSQYFTLGGNDARLYPIVDGLKPREVFHVGINFRGEEAEASLLRRYLEEALAQVRAKPKFAEAAAFGSVRQLVSHIRTLADAEMSTVPTYREEAARKDAPSKDVVCERIRQETPANSVDGMWANTFTPTSIPKRWQLLVEKIRCACARGLAPLRLPTVARPRRWEEQGEGELEKNHAYIWRQLTRSIGLRFPQTEDAAFAAHAELADESFVNPALATAFANLHGYWPEKLGAIAYFETMSSPFSHRSAQQLRLYGVDPSFYVVHRSIDNAKNGHAATILEAIVDYVDSTAYGASTAARGGRLGAAGEASGAQPIHASGAGAPGAPSEAELVARVFAGFLLYELSFSMLDAVAATRLAEGATCPDEDFEWMVGFVRRFADEASPFHKRNVTSPPAAVAVQADGSAVDEPAPHVRLGELMLEDPAAFVRHVSERCDLINAGVPESSKLLRYFGFGGPMYGVATADDLQHIERWIRSVARRGSCGAD